MEQAIENKKNAIRRVAKHIVKNKTVENCTKSLF